MECGYQGIKSTIIASLLLGCGGQRPAVIEAAPESPISEPAGKDINKNVQVSVEIELLDKSGVAVTVVCPKIKDVESAKCDASTDAGLHFSVTVTKGKDGVWGYQTEGVVFAAQVEKAFNRLYAEKYSFVLEKITCPAIVKLGNEAVCDGLDQGVKIPIEVLYTIKDGNNDIDFRPTSGIILVAKLEAALADEGKGITEVDCGKPRLIVSVPDKQFECKLGGAEGPIGIQKIVITNENGSVKFL